MWVYTQNKIFLIPSCFMWLTFHLYSFSQWIKHINCLPPCFTEAHTQINNTSGIICHCHTAQQTWRKQPSCNISQSHRFFPSPAFAKRSCLQYPIALFNVTQCEQSLRRLMPRGLELGLIRCYLHQGLMRQTRKPKIWGSTTHHDVTLGL